MHALWPCWRETNSTPTQQLRHKMLDCFACFCNLLENWQFVENLIWRASQLSVQKDTPVLWFCTSVTLFYIQKSCSCFSEQYMTEQKQRLHCSEQDINRQAVIIVHWTYYLFSDCAKAYSEFSKSTPLTPSTLYLFIYLFIILPHRIGYKYKRKDNK